MAKLRLNEALARAEMNGVKHQKKDLARLLWPNSTTETQQVNMTNLCTGTTKKINPEWVDVLCRELKCDANFLFNIEPVKK